MALSVRRMPDAFARWEFVTVRPRHARRGKTGHVERLIGSIRRECLDHMVVFGEADLRRLLKSYASYYNRVRTHLSLNKNAPLFRPRQTVGNIMSIPILGGLHHLYVRV